MKYRLVVCDSLITKITKKDTLFGGVYTLDPYQNCEFGCLYCDSSFDSTIHVKSNAVELLEKEIQSLKKGTIIVGSVNDPYQEAEKKYRLTRDILKIIRKYDFPCHILTKSNLVLRDTDILTEIEDCKVTISLLSLNETISKLFEPLVPLPKERLQTVKTLSEMGIRTGVALIPVLQYIVDNEIEEIIQSASLHKAQYFMHKHLELKGDQKRCFLDIIAEHYPHFLSKYEDLYQDSTTPKEAYILELNEKIKVYSKKYF